MILRVSNECQILLGRIFYLREHLSRSLINIKKFLLEFDLIQICLQLRVQQIVL